MRERAGRDILELSLTSAESYAQLQKARADRHELDMHKAEQLVGVLKDALLEVREYLDDRADASAEGDPLEYVPNDAMRLLGVVDEALRKAGEEI